MIALRRALGLSQLLGLIVGSLFLGGCLVAARPKDVFTIEAANVDYPVMFSLGPAAEPGRRISASGELSLVSTDVGAPVANNLNPMMGWGQSISGLLPSLMFLRQVQPGDRWLQIDRAQFRGEDFLSTFGSSASKKFTIEGTVHR